MRATQPPESRTIRPDATFIAIALTVELLLATISLLANSVILVSFARCRLLRKRSSNVLLIFLAAGDLLHVVVSLPISIAITLGYPHSFYACLFLACTSTLPMQLVVSTSFIVALERFAAVRWPYKHAQYSSRSTVAKVVVALWMLGASFIYLPMFGWNMGWINNGKCSYHRLIDKQFRIYAIFFPSMLVPLLAMTAMYAYIVFVAIKTSRTVQPAPDAVTDDNRRTAVVATKKFGVILVAYVVFLLPVDMMNCAHLWLGYICVACTRIATWGFLCHGFVCPIIYTYQNKLLRTVVWLTLRWRPINEHELWLEFGSGGV